MRADKPLSVERSAYVCLQHTAPGLAVSTLGQSTQSTLGIDGRNAFG